MPQPTFSAIRAGFASYLSAAIPGLRAVANRPAQINPPAAFIAPTAGGTFIRYSETMDGETTYTLRVIVLVAPGDSTFGEDLLDPYADPQSATSIYKAVQKDPTLGGIVSYAAVLEATGYGLMNVNGIDYLAAHFITEIGT